VIYKEIINTGHEEMTAKRINCSQYTAREIAHRLSDHDSHSKYS